MHARVHVLALASMCLTWRRRQSVAMSSYVLFGGRVVECVAESVRLWRTVVECGAELSSVAQSCRV